MFEAIGCEGTGFDDFRANGLLLPASDAAAMRIGLPLHRGPHRHYNALAMERVGQIEAGWSEFRLRAPDAARGQALMRLDLLRKALRRRLLDPVGRRFRLNRNDPIGASIDFSEIDAMAETLWGESAPIQSASTPARVAS